MLGGQLQHVAGFAVYRLLAVQLRLIVAGIVGRRDVAIGGLAAHALTRRDRDRLGQAGTHQPHIAFHLKQLATLGARGFQRLGHARFADRLDDQALRLVDTLAVA